MNTEKLDLLREALPYIQKFKGKTFVVKFSGKVTEDKENLASLGGRIGVDSSSRNKGLRHSRRRQTAFRTR